MKRKVKQHEPIAEWATMDLKTGLILERHLTYDYKDFLGHYPIAIRKPAWRRLPWWWRVCVLILVSIVSSLIFLSWVAS